MAGRFEPANPGAIATSASGRSRHGASASTGRSGRADMTDATSRKRISTRTRKAWTRRGPFTSSSAARPGCTCPSCSRCASEDAASRPAGSFYRALYRKAYLAIKSVRPDALVGFGETSPWGSGFLAHALCLKPTTGDCSPLVADWRAHHPYQWDIAPDACDRGRRAGGLDPGIGGIGVHGKDGGLRARGRQELPHPRGRSGALVPDRVRSAGRAALGLPRPSIPLAAQWALTAMRVAEEGGAKQLVWYGMAPTDASNVTSGDAWDTSLWGPVAPGRSTRRSPAE